MPVFGDLGRGFLSFLFPLAEVEQPFLVDEERFFLFPEGIRFFFPPELLSPL